MPNRMNENSSNSELVQELIEVLKKEASLFETFMELLERQQEALVKNDVTALNQITELQREKTIECRILAGQREAITGRLALEHGSAEDITVSKLVASVPPGQASMLETLRETILDLNDKISKIRSRNEMLINRSRESIMKTVELLGRFKLPPNGYHEKGKVN
jgi:molybdopterin converting factor small subunit